MKEKLEKYAKDFVIEDLRNYHSFGGHVLDSWIELNFETEINFGVRMFMAGFYLTPNK